MLLVQIIRVPEAGIDRLRRFESAVLPLLGDHGAQLERRLRSVDGDVEIHVVRFPSREAHARYLADPRRHQNLHLLRESGATAELLEVTDISQRRTDDDDG
jgi:hypothetical protein